MENVSFTVAKILQRIDYFGIISYKYNMYRHKKIMLHLLPYLKKAESITKEASNLKLSNNTAYENQKVIWIFWWQGKENMTHLTQKCYRSILKNKGKYKVILITEQNIQNYAKFPDYIYQKLRKGYISLTHFSDILRFNLLSQYGGLWLDLTIFVTSSLDNVYIDDLFTCSGYNSKNNFNVSNGRWTGFAIGGPKGSELFRFMNTFFMCYWKEEDSLEDYFTIDYGLNFAWNENLSNFPISSELNKTFAPNLFNLQQKLNRTYSPEVAKSLTGDTSLFKLSNKKRINEEDSSNFFNNLEDLYKK